MRDQNNKVADPWAQKIREEVKDKLGVVFHGANGYPLQRACALKQCEDFLVELFQQARDADRAELARLAPPEARTEEQQSADYWFQEVLAGRELIARAEARCAALEGEIARLTVLQAPNAAALCAVLKAECERQHDRAESAEAQLAGLEGEIGRLQGYSAALRWYAQHRPDCSLTLKIGDVPYCGCGLEALIK